MRQRLRLRGEEREVQKRVNRFGGPQSKIDGLMKEPGEQRDTGKERREEEIHKRSRKEGKEKENQFMEPNNCSRRSSTVHCISDDDPALCEVACDCGRCGRILKDPESIPLDRDSIRRPICAELLKNTCRKIQVTVCQINPHGCTKWVVAAPWSRAGSPSPVFSRT